MFNIGFSEMLVIGIIALIVVGPDKLPELARTVGKWVGAARRVFADVKAEVDEQIMMDDIVRHNRAIMDMEVIPPERKAGERNEPEPLKAGDKGAASKPEADESERHTSGTQHAPDEPSAPDRIH